MYTYVFFFHIDIQSMMMYTKQRFNALVRDQLQISSKLTLQEFGAMQLPPFKHSGEHTAKRYKKHNSMICLNRKTRIESTSISENFYKDDKGEKLFVMGAIIAWLLSSSISVSLCFITFFLVSVLFIVP